VEQLVVMEIGSQRVISTTRFPHELHGLAATPDGATIYALAAPDSAQPAGEIGRIVLPPTDTVTWVRVPAARGLVLVDAARSVAGAEGRTLRACSFRQGYRPVVIGRTLLVVGLVPGGSCRPMTGRPPMAASRRRGISC
jgi:hypothetical protein